MGAAALARVQAPHTLSRRFAPPYPGTSLKRWRFMTSRYKQAKTVQPELGRCAGTRLRPFGKLRTGQAQPERVSLPTRHSREGGNPRALAQSST